MRPPMPYVGGKRTIADRIVSLIGAHDHYLDGYITRLVDAASRLRGVSLEQQDGIDVIRAYDAPGTCFYVDPPYLGTARARDTLLHPRDARRARS